MWASHFVRIGNNLSISSWLTTEVQVCRNLGRPNPRPPNLVFNVTGVSVRLFLWIFYCASFSESFFFLCGFFVFLLVSVFFYISLFIDASVKYLTMLPILMVKGKRTSIPFKKPSAEKERPFNVLRL